MLKFASEHSSRLFDSLVCHAVNLSPEFNEIEEKYLLVMTFNHKAPVLGHRIGALFFWRISLTYLFIPDLFLGFDLPRLTFSEQQTALRFPFDIVLQKPYFEPVLSNLLSGSATYETCVWADKSP